MNVFRNSHPDIALTKGPGIIQAVSDHHDTGPLLLKVANIPELVLRRLLKLQIGFPRKEAGQHSGLRGIIS